MHARKQARHDPRIFVLDAGVAPFFASLAGDIRPTIAVGIINKAIKIKTPPRNSMISPCYSVSNNVSQHRYAHI
jgi:hypothetical protein